MSWLVDTNALSELVRAEPDPAVLGWFADVPETSLYISVLTLGELREGVDRMPAGARRKRIQEWLERDVPARFGNRVLAIDLPVADRWGKLLAAVPRTLPAIDSLLAATALRWDLRLVTRNVADFADTGVEVVNPWLGGRAR